MLKNENVLNLIKHALNIENANVYDLKRVGGLTNVNYSVKVDDEEFIVRLAGEGTKDLVNRTFEKDNLMLGTSIGINPELVYYNDQTGMKITRKIQNPTTLPMHQAKQPQKMNQIIDIFQKLHSSRHVMPNRFELSERMTHYENLVKDIRPNLFKNFLPLKAEIVKLKNVYHSLRVQETPCHIDTVCDNFVSSGTGKLYLIDWEYSGMFDPMWDLATFILDTRFTKDEEYQFVQKYFGRNPTEQEQQRIGLHKVFQDYLWSLWGVYKVACGDPLEEYANNLFKRTQKNLALYKETYEEQPV